MRDIPWWQMGGSCISDTEQIMERQRFLVVMELPTAASRWLDVCFVCLPPPFFFCLFVYSFVTSSFVCPFVYSLSSNLFPRFEIKLKNQKIEWGVPHNHSSEEIEVNMKHIILVLPPTPHCFLLQQI